MLLWAPAAEGSGGGAGWAEFRVCSPPTPPARRLGSPCKGIGGVTYPPGPAPFPPGGLRIQLGPCLPGWDGPRGVTWWLNPNTPTPPWSKVPEGLGLGGRREKDPGLHLSPTSVLGDCRDQWPSCSSPLLSLKEDDRICHSAGGRLSTPVSPGGAQAGLQGLLRSLRGARQWFCRPQLRRLREGTSLPLARAQRLELIRRLFLPHPQHPSSEFLLAAAGSHDPSPTHQGPHHLPLGWRLSPYHPLTLLCLSSPGISLRHRLRADPVNPPLRARPGLKALPVWTQGSLSGTTKTGQTPRDLTWPFPL